MLGRNGQARVPLLHLVITRSYPEESALVSKGKWFWSPKGTVSWLPALQLTREFYVELRSEGHTSIQPQVLWILGFLLVLTDDTTKGQLVPFLGSLSLSSNEAAITWGLFFSALIKTYQSSLETWPHLGFQYAVTWSGKILRELLHVLYMSSWLGGRGGEPKGIPEYIKTWQPQSCHLRQWMPCRTWIWTFLVQACPQVLHRTFIQKQTNPNKTNRQKFIHWCKSHCIPVPCIFIC